MSAIKDRGMKHTIRDCFHQLFVEKEKARERETKLDGDQNFVGRRKQRNCKVKQSSLEGERAAILSVK